ncbi:MAG: VWA domain-containing protein [Fuerstiella sp.]|nr:VWA domain-containing protein [Fuerstiella sp.]MCP4511951.1 VWA domain-containing protein [Fuerstiella sp.]
MNVFRFGSPWAWLLLIPFAAVVVVQRRREQPAALYSSVQLLKSLPVTYAQRVRRILPAVKLAGLILVIGALARPQLGREEFRIRTEGIAVQMCIDRSGSMQALDFPVDGRQVDRLTAVKSVLQKFVAGNDDFSGRPDDLIGLVAFGGFATALCPPTLDHGALLEVLRSVEIPMPIRDDKGRVINERLLQEEQATAIGDALALAVDRLKDLDSESKVIVLLSDGENTAGVISPEDAAEAAAQFGIKIYAIGVGTTGMAPYSGVDIFGRSVLQPQRVRLDEATLKMLAERTGGQYFNAQDTETLEYVYAEIDQLEKTEVEGRLYTEYREVFGFPMVSGVLCVLACIILDATWLRSLP